MGERPWGEPGVTVPAVEGAHAAATAIEASCFRAVIRQCKASESPIRRSWDSEEFVRLYTARCGTLFSHLDPLSSVCAAYGAGLTERLAWPDGFKTLAADRKAKGFNVVQIVAGSSHGSARVLANRLKNFSRRRFSIS